MNEKKYTEEEGEIFLDGTDGQIKVKIGNKIYDLEGHKAWDVMFQ